MASPPLTIKTPKDIRDDYLRTIKNGLISRGVANPNVSPGSDEYVRATAIANEVAVIEANDSVAVEQRMPDTAIDDDLRRWLQLFDDDFRPAVGSAGFVTFSSSSSTTISSGTQLVDSSQLRYQVTQTATYANGDLIPVAAVDTGAATNHDAGDVLTWVAAPPTSDPTAAVASGGLIDGAAAETNEQARARLLARMQNPPSSGNWQHVATLAEESTPAVEKAYVYPAIQGPGSVHFAVTRRATTTATTGSKSADRDLDATVLSTIVTPYVKGLYPERADVKGTTVANVATDVAIGLSLPASPQASPPGPGGGWLDGTPWPANTADAAFKCTVTAVTSSTTFTVDAPTAPLAGASRIAYLSPSDWTLRTARVVSFTGSAGAYVVTIDNPFTGIAGGDYIWPQCQNAQTYVTALLNAFGAMGPGEKTASVGILARAFRHPLPQVSWPYALGAAQLRALTDAGDEVLSAAWNYRSTTTPAVPGSVTSPPNILVPRRIGFYPAAT